MKIGFTGHRPHKLASYDWKAQKNQELIKKILYVVVDLIDDYYEEEEFDFWSGGALGVDQMSFYICNELKQTYDKVKTTLAIPFKEQASKWNNSADLERYSNQLKGADKVIYVDTVKGYKVKKVPDTIYHPDKLTKRDEYVVDNVDIMIAVWNGEQDGGTYKTMKYAKEQGLDIILIDSTNLSVHYLDASTSYII